MSHPITRIFPFDRGLFEDKVANFWFASNVMIKWRLLFDRGALVKLSALMTAVGFTPAVVGLIGGGLRARPSVGKRTTAESAADAPTPTLPLLPYALLTSSLSFFLFSFQVHEKTIVLPLLPMTMLLSGATIGSSVHKWGVLVNNIAVFRCVYWILVLGTTGINIFFRSNSMWPLLKRDGQGVQYIAMLLLWNRLVGYNPLRVRSRGFVDFLSIVRGHHIRHTDT
jgi:alpha-1,3-glucosyltransferase